MVTSYVHTIIKCLIIMPRGEFICRTKLPLQYILFTLVSTLQVIVFCRHAVVATILNPTIEDYTVHIL